MSRFEPRVLSPREQAATDAVAEAALRYLKHLLRPGVPVDRAAHAAYVAQMTDHSEACDCAACLGAAPEQDGPASAHIGRTLPK